MSAIIEMYFMNVLEVSSHSMAQCSVLVCRYAVARSNDAFGRLMVDSFICFSGKIAAVKTEKSVLTMARRFVGIARAG